MKKLSIVILTWNSEKDIKPCLDSLITSLEGIKYEIILVDNGSTDNTHIQ
jgi:glycosyltransferase involved in cell wall biosynthesis